MRHITNSLAQIEHSTAVAVGKFDGLHKGHVHLLNELHKVSTSHGLAAAVFSFSSHPAQVLHNVAMPPIISVQEKLLLLEQLRIDYFVEIPFTKAFAQTSPEDFAADILVGWLKCKMLVVGEGFRFGKEGKGDVATAQTLGGRYGFDVHVVPHIHGNGAKISSSDIRNYIAQGDFDKVQEATGRSYSGADSHE